ncbi:TRAP transporter small permease [Vibrio sp. E150_011]
MQTILTLLDRAEKTVLVIAFVAMVIATFIQVINRNFFGIPLVGIEEIAKYSMVYLVMLGTELGLRDGTQIRVTAFVDKLPHTLKFVIVSISKIILIIFAALMSKESVTLFQLQISSGQLSSGLKIPMYIPYFALLIGFTSITATQSVALFNDFKKFKTVKETV